MQLRYLALLIVLLLGGSLLAQRSEPPEDEITFADGTTDRVFLRRATPPELTRTISFRRTAEGDEERAGPGAVTGFRFGKSGRRYRSVEVELVDPDRDGAEVSQRRFGEVLASGAVELIKVHLTPEEYNSNAADNQPYLYLLREGEVELVLKLTTILVYERLHANPARFRNLLKFLTRDCPKALELAKSSRFYDSDILRVLAAYANCKEIGSLGIDSKRIRGGLDLDHFGRVFHLGMRDGDFSRKQFSLGVGYQVATRFNDRFRRVAVLVSLDYVYHTFRWEDISDVAQSMVRGNLSMGYSPVLTDRFSVQLLGGLSNYNAFSSSFGSFFSNNYFMLNGGVRITHDNFLFGLNYEHLPGQIQRRPENMLLTTIGYRIRL